MRRLLVAALDDDRDVGRRRLSARHRLKAPTSPQFSSALQGGVSFGISLIVGGMFFARMMRRFGFTTLIDPFEARFGKRWAAVLFLPALAGEVFWSAELLVAIGSTFGVLLGMDLTTAILLSAIVTTAYTAFGGMWSVAWTDIFQLGLVAIGLAAALPFALHGAGGLRRAWLHYVAARPGRQRHRRRCMRSANGLWTAPAIVSWWDVSLMLVFGGIPWNCYFQRVLSCRTPRQGARPFDPGRRDDDRVHGPAAADGHGRVRAIRGRRTLAARLAAQPRPTRMPLLFAHAVPPRDRHPRAGGDHRRGDVELQLVDPVGGIDVQLELPEAAGAGRR